MTRSGRMKPVQAIVDATERHEATELAASEEKLAACERKLDELKQYEHDYRESFNARVTAGMGGRPLRDYQLFLARLAEAIRQQNRIVLDARAQRDTRQEQWREAARRHKAVDHVVDNWRADERRIAERREQRDSDERAQRNVTHRIE
ncbi:MAG TPA: flagellar export protein FliJ [Steroidobacteraceae bacterium]|nr:flagellar export protein FliJ [Steroidobacteraceae bacterium]